MPLRPPNPRAFRLSNSLPRQPHRHLSQPAPTSTTPTKPPPRLDPISIHRLETQRRAYFKRRSLYAGAGLIFSAIGLFFTAQAIPLNPPSSLDSSRRPDDPLVVLGRERKVVVQKLGEEPEEKADLVDSGTSSVGGFPRVLDFADAGEEVEYQLLGLGIRTVSFLGIQVYVVGLYIAADDIARFQEALIRTIDPVASTLVAGEKEKLKAILFDPVKSEEVWGSVLKETGVRTLIRIVPTRNTDFAHLRDAWVRQITARAQSPAYKEEYADESFGASVQELKKLLNRGSIPKGKELLLSRDVRGRLVVWYDDGKLAQRLGMVEDERISRAVWLNYLAGKTVASEPARKNIVEGIMEFVERPIGTVAAQVHV